MELENAVLLGDCLEVLRQIPDDYYHAVVTDAPYGLGDREPTPEEILLFVQGMPIKTGDFMNNDWDIPSVPVWKEVFRVLKPGGHVLCFGGTRTWDLIGIGLRMAGFESRDTIADVYPALQWFHGQGMPKSHNISKAIDKKAGAKREVVGPYRTPEGGQELTTYNNWQDSKIKDGTQERRQPMVTTPATPEAKLWDGYGTGLKPCWEPIVVFRKPFKGTVSANVLQHGTGALNIDACRVKHASKADFEAHKAQVEAVKAKGGVREGSWKNASDLSGASDVTEAGRWPTNAVLAHHPECKKVGSKKVKAHPAWNDNRGPSSFTGEETSPVHHTDEDGTETIEAWECVPGCPVAVLDEQSGERRTTYISPHHQNRRSEGGMLGDLGHPGSQGYDDTGGASRFFPQFEGDQTPEGRWPPNATLTHHPDCKVIGSRKVDAPVINRFDDGAKPFGNGAGHPYTSTQTGDAEGKEEIPVWECVEGCPIKELDGQSGELHSGYMSASQKRTRTSEKPNWRYHKGKPSESGTYGDSGGASRFFEQFQSVGTHFKYTAKPSKRETSLDGQIENDHPTKKPLELMRWLIRLVTFKGAKVLDLYCGSGTTLHAAAEEGVVYTGIERDKHSYEIAVRRMEIVLGFEQERQAQMDVFDLAMELGDEEDS